MNSYYSWGTWSLSLGGAHLTRTRCNVLKNILNMRLKSFLCFIGFPCFFRSFVAPFWQQGWLPKPTQPFKNSMVTKLPFVLAFFFWSNLNLDFSPRKPIKDWSSIVFTQLHAKSDSQNWDPFWLDGVTNLLPESNQHRFKTQPQGASRFWKTYASMLMDAGSIFGPKLGRSCPLESHCPKTHLRARIPPDPLQTLTVIHLRRRMCMGYWWLLAQCLMMLCVCLLSD